MTIIFIWSAGSNAERTSKILDKLYLLLLNYDTLKRRVDKVNLLLDNLVKPDSLLELKFLR